MENRNGIEYMIKKKVEIMGFKDTNLNKKITHAIMKILDDEKIFDKKKVSEPKPEPKPEISTNKWNPGCPRASSNTFGDNPDWGKGENWDWMM